MSSLSSRSSPSGGIKFIGLHKPKPISFDAPAFGIDREGNSVNRARLRLFSLVEADIRVERFVSWGAGSSLVSCRVGDKDGPKLICFLHGQIGLQRKALELNRLSGAPLALENICRREAEHQVKNS